MAEFNKSKPESLSSPSLKHIDCNMERRKGTEPLWGLMTRAASKASDTREVRVKTALQSICKQDEG